MMGTGLNLMTARPGARSAMKGLKMTDAMLDKISELVTEREELKKRIESIELFVRAYEYPTDAGYAINTEDLLRYLNPEVVND